MDPLQALDPWQQYTGPGPPSGCGHHTNVAAADLRIVRHLVLQETCISPTAQQLLAGLRRTLHRQVTPRSEVLLEHPCRVLGWVRHFPASIFGQAFPPSVGMLGTGLGMSSVMGNPYQQFMRATSPQMGQGQSFAGNFTPSTMRPPGPGSFSGAPLNATQMMEHLNTTPPAGEQPSVKSAFELLGRNAVTAPPVQQDSNEVMLRALTAALSGDKKSLPQWNGNIESLRPWLRSLLLWELDNHLPKQRWGLKLLQSFPEGSVPRKVAEALDLSALSSEHGYSAILSAILTKYGPYLEAAGPAAVENFFYGSERSRSESLATYIAAKEIALAELESQVGEKVPPWIAGRMLLRHANLSETQKEALAIKYNSLLPFEQMAAALRPLDRPEALVHRVAKTFLAAGSKDDEEAAEEVDYEDEELVPDEDWEEGPESDGEGGMNCLLFDTHQELSLIHI